MRGGESLEEALTSLNDWAFGVTRTRQEREADLTARRNTQRMRSVGIDVEELFA